MVVTFVLAGRYVETRAKRRAGAALRALLEIGAKDVSVLDDDGRERRVPVDELRVGDRFVVRPGEKIATDGVVEVGSSAVDMALLTGESVPRRGAARRRGLRSDDQRGRPARGTRDERRRRHCARADRAARDGGAVRQGARAAARGSCCRSLRPVVIALALGTLAYWLVDGAGTSFAFAAAVAVLIIACPCALGLATPTALLVGTGRGAQLGIVIRGPEILESTRQVDTVVLDKTGTVTTGTMALDEIVTDGADPEEALRLAAALESASEHPVARAIAEAGGEAGLPAGRELPRTGRASGSKGVVDGHAVVEDGGRSWPSRAGLPSELANAQALAEREGKTAIAAGVERRGPRRVRRCRPVKPTSAEAVRRLRELGLRPVLLTGDNEETAHGVAARWGSRR